MSKLKVLTISSIGEDVEQLEFSSIATRKIKWYNLLKKNCFLVF